MQFLTSLHDVDLVRLLSQGTVGIMPTDTIYGLVALASNQQAVTRLYAIKHREHKPGTVLAANVEQLVGLGLHKLTLRAVAHLWPNPLSIIIPTSKDLHYLDQGLGGLAVRIPDDPSLRQVLLKTGPLITSSANPPGESPANTAQEAQAYFGEQVDWYLDGGKRDHRAPSTVVRYKNGTFEVLRAGAIMIDERGVLKNDV